MIERGHRLEIGRQGIVGFAAYQKRPRIAQDVGVDAVFFNNPDLPETHSEVALPLVVQNQLIGILDIQSQERNAFSDADIHTLQTMADQIALAIENTRLIDQSHAAIQELQLLTSENTLRVWRERLGRQSIGYAYSSLGVQPLSNVRPADGEKGEHVIKFPIALRGQQIGVLSLKRKSRDSGWTEGEQEMASKIATQIALAIENARLLEDSQTRASRERMIGDVSTRITSSINIENILRTTVQELGLMVPDSEVVVQLQGEPNGSK
jgi:GAF domain-containing protein